MRVQILGQTEEVVAVGKPASMPVHVSGQYRKNTLLSIVETEHPELGTLLPVHRLDKSVSGVLLFARSKAAAENIRHLIQVQWLTNSAPRGGCHIMILAVTQERVDKTSLGVLHSAQSKIGRKRPPHPLWLNLHGYSSDLQGPCF